MVYYYSLPSFVGLPKYKDSSDLVGFHGRNIPGRCKVVYSK